MATIGKEETFDEYLETIEINDCESAQDENSNADELYPEFLLERGRNDLNNVK